MYVGVDPNWVGIPFRNEALTRDRLFGRRMELQCQLLDVGLQLAMVFPAFLSRRALLLRQIQLRCQLNQVDLELELLAEREFRGVERYKAPAGDEPTPLSFRVKADFGPTH